MRTSNERARDGYGHLPLTTTSEPEIRDVWTTRDLPVLRAALARLDAGEEFVELEDIRVELRFTGSEIWAAVDALSHAQPPYIEVDLTSGWTDEHASGTIDRVSERARRELGAWPTPESLVSQIVRALEIAADNEIEPVRKSRLRAAAEAVGTVAREVIVEVVARQVPT